MELLQSFAKPLILSNNLLLPAWSKTSYKCMHVIKLIQFKTASDFKWSCRGLTGLVVPMMANRVTNPNAFLEKSRCLPAEPSQHHKLTSRRPEETVTTAFVKGLWNYTQQWRFNFEISNSDWCLVKYLNSRYPNNQWYWKNNNMGNIWMG